MMKFTRPLLVGCGVAIVMVVGWFLLSKGPLGPIKVTVAKAHKENVTPTVFGMGTVEAQRSYSIGPTQAGRVLKVYVDQGDQVKAGQLLGEIDPVDLAQKLQAASFAVLRAQNVMAASEAQVQDTYSRNLLAQTNAKRYSDLLAANATSQELADAKQTDAKAAQAALDTAKASLAAARESVSQAMADRNAIINQQNSLNLISPASGIIVSRDAEMGTTVVAGQSVFHMIDSSIIWVRTRIDQSRFHGIAVGQPASIALRSRPDSPINGYVARLEVQGDNVTEERFVNVAFSVIPAVIPLGESAEVTITLPSIADALVVPTAAVKRLNKQNGVWVVENDRLRFQPVTVGVQTLDGQTQILAGITADDAVVVYSPKQVSEGMKVRVEKMP